VLKSDIAQRSGGYACATTVAQLVTMMKGIAASDKPERKPQAQKTEMDRFIEQVVDLESDAYCSSLGICLTLVLDNFVVPANEQLHVLVAHQQKRDRKIGFLYGILAGTEKYGPYVSGISHGKEMDPRMILPLQAADFAAYYLGRALRRRRENNVRAWVADELQPHFVKVADAGWATLGWLKGY
jgi:hypothetical protein